MAVNHKRKRRRQIIYFATIAFSILYIVFGYMLATKDLKLFEAGEEGLQPRTARVMEIVDRQEYSYDLGGDDPFTGTNIYFNAKMLDGPQKGTTVMVVQNIDPFFAIQPKEVTQGKKILILGNENADYEAEWMMIEYIRTDTLLVLGIVFCLCLFLFGRIKGVNTIVSLLFTVLSVFMVFIPAVLSGGNVYIWSAVTCIFIIIMTLLLVNGANKKSLAAAVGCFSGVLMVGAIALFTDFFLQLTGMVDEQSVYLQMLETTNPIDLKAIIFAAIIIGAIGAIMDVAMSLSSSLHELSRKAANVTFSNILASGITIGRDIMGTMANTLVLAYIGSSMSLTLLLVAYNHSLIELLNKEMIVVEILQALTGSFGILLTIPLTSIICATLYTKDWRETAALLPNSKEKPPTP